MPRKAKDTPEDKVEDATEDPTDDNISRERGTWELPVKLNHDELLLAAKQMGEAEGERSAITVEKTAANLGFKNRLASVEDTIAELGPVLLHGANTMPVEVIIEKDYEAGTFVVTRQDGGEPFIVEERDLEDYERQAELPEGGEEGAQELEDGPDGIETDPEDGEGAGDEDGGSGDEG